jgi:hypothetical protein
VKPGTKPTAPFDTAVDQVTAAQGTDPHGFQDVRIWFQYTAPGSVGLGGHDDGPVNTTIICDETNQEFLFELRAHAIRRPTVAVHLALWRPGPGSRAMQSGGS